MTRDPSGRGERGGALLDILRRDPQTTQRQIARLAKLSLGTTNKLLRQLAETGCLTIEGGPRERRYVVTPKGMTERFRAVYAMAADAVRDVALLEKTIQVEVMKAYARGTRAVTVVGRSTLSEMAGRAVLDLGLVDLSCSRVEHPSELPPGDLLALLDEPYEGADSTDVRARLIAEMLVAPSKEESK
ncbi:MAG: winged helix-turn-helix transcriptional regulator [Elusimicrobia bacterium]|nr:winged helix-turn-helix transcriptional regulator [Elusimicrobiota bacterium]